MTVKVKVTPYGRDLSQKTKVTSVLEEKPMTDPIKTDAATLRQKAQNLRTLLDYISVIDPSPKTVNAMREAASSLDAIAAEKDQPHE